MNSVFRDRFCPKYCSSDKYSDYKKKILKHVKVTKKINLIMHVKIRVTHLHLYTD